MYTKDRAYMLSKSFLMNDFLESFLVMFGKNKYTNLRRHWTIFFCHKTDSKNDSFEYNGYKALIKYI